MVSSRIESLDFVKFVAILLVCIGHCYAKVPSLESSLHSIIYSFHMPLFMLVCGYFSVRSLELSMVELFLKKGKQLIIPTLSCTLVTLCLYGGGLEVIGCVWFLKVLFACYLIARGCKLTGLPVEMAYIISWIVLLLIPYGSTLQMNFLYFYFIVGYLFHKWQSRIMKFRLGIFVISLLFFIYSINCHWAIPCKRVDLMFLLQSPQLFVIQLFTGLCGSLTIVGVCSLVDKFVKSNSFGHEIILGLSLIGRYTLGIYVVQTFLLEKSLPTFNEGLSFINSGLMDYLFIPLVGFVICIVCYFVVRFTQQVKLINTLFYGGMKY